MTKKISKHEENVTILWKREKLDENRKRERQFDAESRDSESFESHSDREKLLIILVGMIR